MKKYNGIELKNLMDNATKHNITFEIKIISVQGLKGVYIEFSDFIEDDGQYINVALIESID